MFRPHLVPTTLFVLTNFLFAYKYSSRILSFAFAGSVLYSLALLAGILNVWRVPDRFFHKKALYVYLLLFVAGCICLMHRIRVEDLNVDRWSVITSFLDTLLSGRFPYLARSHLGNPPGPFPFYFVLAAPFYLIGEIGYFSLLGFLGFALLVGRVFRHEKTKIVLAVLLSTSPAFLWEMSVRSTIVVNMVILLLYLKWLESAQLSHRSSSWLAGALGGLLLSTRGVVAIPLLSYFSHRFLRRREWSSVLVLGAFLLIGFSATILPFAIWSPALFLKHNPVTLQASFLPFGFLVAFAILSVLAGLKAQSIEDLYRFVGVLLFCVVGTSFAKTIIEHGWEASLFGHGFDISYFLFSVPFLLLGIPDELSPENEAPRTAASPV